jgi:hypothetical protein
MKKKGEKRMKRVDYMLKICGREGISPKKRSQKDEL